ncbi:uncharacterized protein LOC124162709 isoform X2 [Ischnura elegans]|uniref:uncharacterized protein LOC124162709 isoform X2 n=1 Tax=Ischnura elegans TaxID=197161 RepID=UPI001ED8A274|nr:uncharacterized protein LOC124162709 isoform X2 [Ischnura elegans]
MIVTLPVWWSALLVLCFSYVCSDAVQVPGEDSRLTMVYRRGDVSGLFPFPRVGRSHISEENYDQRIQGSPRGSLMSKRQGLIPFPRVGKRHHPSVAASTAALLGAASGDAFYDEYAAGRPAKGSGRGGMLAPAPVSEEDDPWGIEVALGKRSSEEAAREGMWFGPRLGRRRRRSADDGKHQRGTYWTVVDETGGSAREYLDHRPESMLRNKEMLRPSVEDDDFPAEDSDLLYGDAAETSVTDAGVEEDTSQMGGRRRRRQPVDAGTAKEGEDKAAADGGSDGASAATANRRWKGGRA